MSENTLPAGYVNVGTHIVHVAKLRKHTTDIHRLLEYLPVVLRVEQRLPEDSTVEEVLAEADREGVDPGLLAETMGELGAYQLLAAQELQSVVTHRSGENGAS